MISPKENTLLIADPFLQDVHFQRAVILLCSHDKEGSFGFALNKKFNYGLNQLIPELDHQFIPLFSGGPVGTDTIHFIHQYPESIPDAHQLSNDVFWGGDFEAVKLLLIHNRIDLKKIKFFMGYSGWGAGQLASEIKENTWLTTLSNKQLLFNTDPESVWSESIKQMGPNYTEIIYYPINPQLN